MRFKGKVSWWFYVLILFVAVMQLPLIVTSAFVDRNTPVALFTFVIFLAIEGFCLSIVFHNYVELQKDELLIVFGPIKARIPYNDISSLTPTRNPLSSLAASLDRIEIRCKGKTPTMIAVVEKERFLEEMKKRALFLDFTVSSDFL